MAFKYIFAAVRFKTDVAGISGDSRIMKAVVMSFQI